MPAAGGRELRDLTVRATEVEQRLRALVDERRREDPAPDDPFRGLYLSDEAVDRLLTPMDPGGTREGAQLRAAGGRLGRLTDDAGLTELDVELLVIALLPDLDARYERLYGYLNDDVTRRRASPRIALELAGAAVASAPCRARLLPGAPLVDRALVEVEDGDRPFLSRSLRVPDRVAGHLLGDDTPDRSLAAVLTDVAPYDGPLAHDLARAFESGLTLVHVRQRLGGAGWPLAVAALHRAGRAPVGLDLVALAEEPDPVAVIDVAGREALLRRGGIVAGPVEALAAASARALRRLVALPAPVLLVGAGSWNPEWGTEVPVLVDVPVTSWQERVQLWEQELDRQGVVPDAGLALQPPAHLQLGPEQVARAVRGAAVASLVTGLRLDDVALHRGVRAQNAAGLERLARRLEPQVGWDDLVLPPAVLGEIREVAARARFRDRVLVDWRMRPGGGRGRGVTALFTGDSGTGKTMAAEVIAGELGLDLYTVDLATVVDKYVGETEKNLERIFDEASGVNGVLLFDEADAVFGKRSEVRDAHDRYANIESAYLLQRMESFDGLAVLATNLRANIDDAFTRRLDAVVDFPTPTEEFRLALWQRCLAPPLPIGDDLDLAFCARAFELSGGNIRSCCLTAAYLAAEQDVPVGMRHLIAAVQREYRKLGRLVLAREFGEHLRAAP